MALRFLVTDLRDKSLNTAKGIHLVHIKVSHSMKIGFQQSV